MRDELARTMAELELAGSAKSYFPVDSMWNVRRGNVSATLGALLDSDIATRRTIDIDLRVGDDTFDNSNFGRIARGTSITLAEDDDYDAVRRQLWLVTDGAYKQATETLERKRVRFRSACCATRSRSVRRPPPITISRRVYPSVMRR